MLGFVVWCWTSFWLYVECECVKRGRWDDEKSEKAAWKTEKFSLLMVCWLSAISEWAVERKSKKKVWRNYWTNIPSIVVVLFVLSAAPSFSLEKTNFFCLHLACHSLVFTNKKFVVLGLNYKKSYGIRRERRKRGGAKKISNEKGWFGQ